MAHPLMPKATALWLIDNTALSFQQIAQVCGLHILEVQALADGEVTQGLMPFDPVANHQLDLDDIHACEKDPNRPLHLVEMTDEEKRLLKGGKYMPLSRRKDRPDGIAWLLKFHPEFSDSQIMRLLGTTKATIEAIRKKTHWNAANIKPRNPVVLELCSQQALDQAIKQAGRSVTEGAPASEDA
jgi:hypothetical protein